MSVLDEILGALEEALPADLMLLHGSFLASRTTADRLAVLLAIEELLRRTSHATRWLPRPDGLDSDASFGALEEAMRHDTLAIGVNWIRSALRAQERGDVAFANQTLCLVGNLLRGILQEQKPQKAGARASIPWAEIRVGMTFEEVTSLEVISCIGLSTPDCQCQTCQDYDALVCKCGDPFVDHGAGGHNPCTLCGCEVFSLASWAGGPPPPPKEPRTPPRALIVPITAAPVATRGPRKR